MKIELHKIGWAHSNSCNWNYYIWNCYGENSGRIQCKETFGGDYRLKERLQAAGHIVEVFNGMNIGKFGFRDTGKLPDIESEEVFNRLTQ